MEGITILPVVSKIFGRVSISGIKKGVDNILRKKQVGFRENKVTLARSLFSGNIREQVNEWNVILHICFIDFEKAFDSVRRESVRNSMQGIPEDLITLVNAMYDNFEWAVLEKGEQWNGFKFSQE